ncbi:MAG: undecaprenyl-diphosphate phosphatase [Clostridia bacterium]|nr:undecaprenyl-diphosphate phosphatase [Clostridia bacterium]
MTYLKAILLGLTQGLTEFLPVSSSGHLLLLEKLCFAPTSLFLNLVLHIATLLAVLIVMRREIRSILRHPFSSELKYICLASCPTVLIALLFSLFLPDLLTGAMLPFGFLLTSALLFLTESLSKGRGREIGVKNSLFTGVMQGIAVLPGVSRSGATICALRLTGVEGDQAAAFSFLLSLPVIAGGFLSEGIKSGFSVEGAAFPVVGAAFLAAFLSGLFAARFMLKRAKKGLLPFAIYTLLIGAVSFFLL